MLTARLLPCKMPLRKVVLCLRLRIARDALQSKNLLTPTKTWLNWEMLTNLLQLQRGNWKGSSISWEGILKDTKPFPYSIKYEARICKTQNIMVSDRIVFGA